MHFTCFNKYIWRVHLHIQMKSNKRRVMNIQNVFVAKPVLMQISCFVPETLLMALLLITWKQYVHLANYCKAFRTDRYLSGSNWEIPPHSKKYALQIFSPTTSGMRVCHFCCLLLWEIIKKSSGFSPSDLVFGHKVHDPLRPLREKLLSEKSSASENILDHVRSFRERLHHVCVSAQDSPMITQRINYDKKSLARTFPEGKHILALLPICGFWSAGKVFQFICDRPSTWN